MEKWNHSDSWKQQGEHFLVEVLRSFNSYMQEHRWYVYVYIYPRHPHFSKFEGKDLWQEAANAIPKHSYTSYLEYPMYDGVVTCVKVGSDYNHDGDDRFLHYGTPEEAYEVFADAQEAFEFLANYKTS